MNDIRTLALFFATALAGSLSAAPPPSGPTLGKLELTWLTDLPRAQALAKSQGKSVLLFFHGSDWCPTCADLQRQVFGAPEFVQFARQALVLVDVDFPEKQKPAEDTRRANLALKARFNLSPDYTAGYPTLVLLNEAGETIFQETGYGGGGSAEVLPKLRRHAGVIPAAAAGASFKNLNVTEFAQMAADRRNVILDVRTAREFQAGHLPWAINLDVTAPTFPAQAATLDKTKTYLVHCASGVRSLRACEQLGRLDFPRLYNLLGGFRAWEKAGQPVEK